MVEYGISREEEAKLPQFKSHLEARKYFKDKYGDNNFQMMDSYMVGKEKFYNYDLILDRKVYFDKMKEIQEKGIVEITKEKLFCSQCIQISENGFVHIVH